VKLFPHIRYVLLVVANRDDIVSSPLQANTELKSVLVGAASFRSIYVDQDGTREAALCGSVLVLIERQRLLTWEVHFFASCDSSDFIIEITDERSRLYSVQIRCEAREECFSTVSQPAMALSQID
jgi:hypothetical protein